MHVSFPVYFRVDCSALKKRENLHHAKISRYTVYQCKYTHMCVYASGNKTLQYVLRIFESIFENHVSWISEPVQNSSQ